MKRQNSSKSRTKFSPINNESPSQDTSPIVSSQVLAKRALETKQKITTDKRSSNPSVSSMSSPSESMSSSEGTHTRRENSEKSRAMLRISIEKMTEELIHSVQAEQPKEIIPIVKGM